VYRLCALAAILAPIQLLGGVANILIPLIGFLGVYQTIAVMRRGPKAVKQIAADYATVARHGEKLGLQASIGTDLRALLRGWIMEPTPRQEKPFNETAPLRPRLILWFLPGIVALIWGLGLYAGLPVMPDWLREIMGHKSESIAHSVVGWVVFGLWCLLTVASAVLLVRPKDTTDRILLIIDDLDRCLAAESMEILEALKLLLEDPAMAERVQVLALVDEEVLGVAVQEKFKLLIDRRGDSKATIREHMENCFFVRCVYPH
jgi:hypothetical protein